MNNIKDLRNIKRTYCFKRALLKFNKQSDLKLTPSTVFILTVLFEEQEASVYTIQVCLRINKHAYSASIIRGALEQCIGSGWVMQPVPGKNCYKLTETGINALFALEWRIRQERSDK